VGACQGCCRRRLPLLIHGDRGKAELSALRDFHEAAPHGFEMQVRDGKPPASGRLARTEVKLRQEAPVRLHWFQEMWDWN
jgi:hypothetical protein